MTKIWDFNYKGYDCTIAEYSMKIPSFVTSLPSSWFCGYVAIPKDHQLYNKSYDDIDLDCHGGLTYSDSFHNKESKNYNKFMIGFDFNHFEDNGGSYELVENECKRVVEQLLLKERKESDDAKT